MPDLSSVHPSPTDPRAGYKLSAAEMMVEIEEARKLSPEFQIKRLERLLQRTAFIDKEPMNNVRYMYTVIGAILACLMSGALFVDLFVCKFSYSSYELHRMEVVYSSDFSGGLLLV